MAIGAVMAVTLAGCTTSMAPTQSTATKQVSSSEAGLGHPPPPCQTRHLKVFVEQYAAGGFGVKAANSGSTCRLVGAALVQGFDRSGQRIAVMTRRSGSHRVFELRPDSVGVSWMTIDVQHTSCRIALARLQVRVNASPTVSVRGRWFARPSQDHPDECLNGPPVSPTRPYAIETTHWESAPVAPSPGPGN